MAFGFMYTPIVRVVDERGRVTFRITSSPVAALGVSVVITPFAALAVMAVLQAVLPGAWDLEAVRGPLSLGLMAAIAAPLYLAVERGSGLRVAADRVKGTLTYRRFGARASAERSVEIGELVGFDVVERTMDAAPYVGIYALKTDGSRIDLTPGHQAEREAAREMAEALRKVLELPEEAVTLRPSSFMDELKRTFGR